MLSRTGSVNGEFATPGAVIVSVAFFHDPFRSVPGLTDTLSGSRPAAGVISGVASR
jgi:hypothetical protein